MTDLRTTDLDALVLSHLDLIQAADSLFVRVRRWFVREEARLADLLPFRTPIRVRHPELAGPLPLETIIMVENVPYENAARGAHVGKITPAQVTQVATLLRAAVASTELPVWFLAACLDRESRFDPGAYNYNLTAANRTKTILRGDFGVGQFNGRFNREAGWTDQETLAHFFDPSWELPRFGDKYAGLVKWADAVLASPDGPAVAAQVRTAASNPLYATAEYLGLWLATMGYNSGTGKALVDKTEGALGDLFGARKRIAHPNAVMSMAVELRREMGMMLQ